jgi:ATP-dependent exoDNAse (exonuclease V) beta subunit
MRTKTFTHKLQKLEQGERVDGFYQTPEGNFPSVTTVVGWKKNQFFAEWRKNNPKEAVRTRNRGTKLHSLIEKYISNEPQFFDSQDPYTLDLFSQFQNEIDKIDNIRAVEGFLWSKPLRLAGRVDCVADYDGVLSIIDFKGSTKPKRKDDIHNYFLQATAYAEMWNERIGEKINQIVILISCDDGTVQVFKEETKNYKKDLAVAIKEWRNEYEPKQCQ